MPTLPSEKEAEEEVFNAEQQQQSQFRKKQIGQRQIVYNMDQLPTVKSGFTGSRLSHHPYTEGRGEDLFNTTATAHFNNSATLTTMSGGGGGGVQSSKYDNNLLGATIQIKHGKFAGKVDKIIECVTLPSSSSSSSIELVEENVQKNATTTKETTPTSVSTDCNWYVTDNVKIGHAFQKHTFDVLCYNTATATATATTDNNDNKLENFAATVAVAPTINHTTTRSGGSERNLIGATISITKGRYKGMTGIVSERLIIQQYQLDTIPTPLLLDQLQIIKYPTIYTPSSSIDDDDDDDVLYKYIDTHFETKYIGAKVRVLTSTIKDHVGKVGTIENIVSMGDDWYIINNPNIDMALRASKFNIIKYADLPVICIDDDDDDDDNDNDDDDDNNKTDMVGKKNGMVELSNNDEKQQQLQHQDEGMKTAAATTTIAKAVVVRNTMDKETSAAGDEGDSSLLYIPATTATSTTTSTTIVAATATTETIFVDLDNLSSSSDPPLSSTIDVNPIQHHHQPSVKDNNVENGTALPLPVILHDTVDSLVNVEEEVSKNTKSYLKEPSVADESIEMNEKTAATTTKTRKRRRKEVYLVKLPTFESIELASRLSAFDSFLFLVNSDQQQQCTDSTTTSSQVVSDVATTVTKNTEGEGHKRPVEKHVQDGNSTITTKKNEETMTTKTRLFIDSLIQQNKDTHHWPTVLVNPGMEIVIDEKAKQQQQQKRIIPLEERTVRMIPGSIEERKVLMDRLSVFDDYLFLLSQHS